MFVCVAGFSQCHFLCDRLFVLTFSHTEVFRKCRAVMFSLAFVIVFPASVGAMMSAGGGMGVAGLVVPVQAAVQASNHFDLGSYLDHYAY